MFVAVAAGAGCRRDEPVTQGEPLLKIGEPAVPAKGFATVTDANASQAVAWLPIGPEPTAGTLSFNVAHTFERYRSVAIYLRPKGLVPPSSQRGRSGGVERIDRRRQGRPA